ncbi:hypothetical protein CDG76_31460 [Nostoc sp. 'Peltigera membranacea cyanobiont' 210A]|uniref:O-antigen ligase family protein n=1 Tax=Nostoc sp. 'Peltigera membranacea cyanobiont' 210A TaxID=2014529 RepID=UPI000B956F02|nr:O-antigen ligase family protein [Nostoc sp. 'Peltigera membranacea cyanobiont' 210A]OYD90246.1 hypothetical protein CDG76_31460 [Nostoc sp. 'Peltigera membranacea cyanobiont' 210A]
MKEKIVNFEKIFFIFGFIYFTEPFILFADLSSTKQSVIGSSSLPEVTDSGPLLGLRLIVLGITLLLTCIRYKQIIYLASKRKFLWALVGLIILSSLWSPIPELTFRKGIVFFGVILFGLNVSVRYKLKEQLFILAWAMGILVVMNFIFTLVFPSIGIESGEHAGAWRGLFPQKNAFAKMMVLSAMTFIIAVSDKHKYSSILWIFLGFSTILILLSTSKSALVIFLILLALLSLFKLLRDSYNIAIPLLIIALLVIGSIATFLIGNVETIVSFLGRDISLTGRTGIWSVVISKIAQHLWLGYGYKGFWRGMEGDSADVWYETFFTSPNAHNGFLDLTLELGLVGLLFFMSSFIKNWVRAIAWLRLTTTVEGLFPVMYFAYLVLYNITESTLNDPFVWAIYSAVTSTVLTQPIFSRDL